jgi:tRNA modification GTPase
MSDVRDTIFALSSGQGRAGVAVIRVSGSQTRFIFETITKLDTPMPRYAYLRQLFDKSDKLIDSALVFFFENPKSFTGEDCAEFHIHGGRAVIKAFLYCLSEFDDCRLAEAGEFTRRALLNGKIDLLGAEALADLIDSETEAQRDLAIKGQSGRLRNEIEGLREKILDCMALVEAGIDFSDEGDVSPELTTYIKKVIDSAQIRISDLITGYEASERLRRGLRVVLAGPVNAGKSTLINALAGRDVAIVSHIAGTTRDIIEVHLDLKGWPVTIIDTAGLRETSDEIENEGIRRSLEAVGNADIVLNLSPIGTKHDDKAIDSFPLQINIITKVDTDAVQNRHNLCISAKSGFGLDTLLERLTQEAARLMRIGDAPAVTHLRQKQGLSTAYGALKKSENFIDIPELLAEELRFTCVTLGAIIGAIDNEDVLGQIFSRFCIGK